MWLMVQRDEPSDYVLSTGECHSVKEFVEEVSKRSGAADALFLTFYRAQTDFPPITPIHCCSLSSQQS